MNESPRAEAVVARPSGTGMNRPAGVVMNVARPVRAERVTESFAPAASSMATMARPTSASSWACADGARVNAMSVMDPTAPVVARFAKAAAAARYRETLLIFIVIPHQSQCPGHSIPLLVATHGNRRIPYCATPGAVRQAPLIWGNSCDVDVFGRVWARGRHRGCRGAERSAVSVVRPPLARWPRPPRDARFRLALSSSVRRNDQGH